MCLTVPYQIKKISNGQAELSDGRKVKIAMISDLKIGDWVLANADLAVSKITANEAKEINNYFK